MANHYDILYRGNGVDGRPYYGQKDPTWMYHSFERRGEVEADAKIASLVAQGYEAKRIHVGKTRKRDIDD